MYEERVCVFVSQVGCENECVVENGSKLQSIEPKGFRNGGWGFGGGDGRGKRKSAAGEWLRANVGDVVSLMKRTRKDFSIGGDVEEVLGCAGPDVQVVWIDCRR